MKFVLNPANSFNQSSGFFFYSPLKNRRLPLLHSNELLCCVCCRWFHALITTDFDVYSPSIKEVIARSRLGNKVERKYVLAHLIVIGVTFGCFKLKILFHF